MHTQNPLLIFFMKRDLFILVLSFREFGAKVVGFVCKFFNVHPNERQCHFSSPEVEPDISDI